MALVRQEQPDLFAIELEKISAFDFFYTLLHNRLALNFGIWYLSLLLTVSVWHSGERYRTHHGPKVLPCEWGSCVAQW